MPVITERDGPDGKLYTLFESGTILVYLAEKTGQFLPKDPMARLDAIQLDDDSDDSVRRNGKCGEVGNRTGSRRTRLAVERAFLTLTCKSKERAIPPRIRERAGLLPHTEVEFEFDGEVVRILPAKVHNKDSRGRRLVAQLRGRGDLAVTTDAIMALTRDH